MIFMQSFLEKNTIQIINYIPFFKINKASKISSTTSTTFETGIKSKSENNFYSIKVLKKILV